MFVVSVETLSDSKVRVSATIPGSRWEEGSATAKTEAEARDLLEWLLGAKLPAALVPVESRCAKCQQPAEHTDDEGFCGGCLDARVCPDCAEHFDAARGPCPCVVERSELADARRDDDRAAFDASVAA